MALRLPHGFVLGDSHHLGRASREDGVMALALGTRTPVDPNSKTKGTHYGIEGIALGPRPWKDMARSSGAGEEDVVGSSGSPFEEVGRFPSLVDLFLRHGGSLEVVQELIRGIKECTKEELDH